MLKTRTVFDVFRTKLETSKTRSFSEKKIFGEEYSEGLYEIEVSRKTDEYSNIAHVWSKFEIRKSPEKEAYMTGINSISLFFKDGR